METEFWNALESLASGSRVVIDRPRGSRHPKFPDFVYPVDYGYLEGTSAMDGGGIDLYKGTDEAAGIDAVICSVDLMKRDAEIKLLINCSEEEKQLVLNVHNGSRYMKGVLMRRPR